MGLSRWTASMLITAFAFSIGSLGCKDEGPAEKMGKAMDEAAQDVGDAAEDAKEKMEDAME